MKEIVLDETYYPRPFSGGIGIIGNTTVTGTDINIRTVQPAEPMPPPLTGTTVYPKTEPIPPLTGTIVYPKSDDIKISSITQASLNGKSSLNDKSSTSNKTQISEQINNIFSEKNIIYIIIVAILLIWFMR